MTASRAPDMPRGEFGQFISKKCPDANCGGSLFTEGEHSGHRFGGLIWRCNGLTHDREHDPLRECRHVHVDGYPGT